MDRRLTVARIVAAAALTLLVPTAVLCALSPAAPPVVSAGVIESALLAAATAYAMYLGIYRYPR
jgi:hypothetical protein